MLTATLQEWHCPHSAEKKTWIWIQVFWIPEPTHPHQGSSKAYPASALAREGVHQGLHPMVHQYGGVEQELLIAVVLGAHREGVGHERVPVVEMVELQGNAILVLELGAEQQLWVELELQEVAAQLLHVLLDDDLDGLPCEQSQQSTGYSPAWEAAGQFINGACFVRLYCCCCFALFGYRHLSFGEGAAPTFQREVMAQLTRTCKESV